MDEPDLIARPRVLMNARVRFWDDMLGRPVVSAGSAQLSDLDGGGFKNALIPHL